MIDPGRLRQRVRIESRVLTTNAYGEQTETWTTLASRRAEVLPVTGKELFQAAQVEAQVSHRVSLWYLAGVTATSRVVVLPDEQVLNVIFARDPELLHEMLELWCLEAPDRGTQA